MKWFVLMLLPVVGGLPGPAANRYTYADLVYRLADLEVLATRPAAGERTAQWSSYDRSSRYDEATGRFVAWDANADGHGILRREGDHWVLAEMQGPGVIWRIWSATPKAGRVKIYLDEDPEPVVDLPFEGYFSGEHEPFDRPALVHKTAMGWNNYTPIPYQKSCKIVAEEGWGDYYHFTYTTFPSGTEMPTFRRKLDPAGAKALDTVEQMLRRCGPREIRDQIGRDTFEGSLGPGDSHRVRRTGPGAITRVRARVSKVPPERVEETLRSVILEITWDEEARPAVWSPLGDFFGTAPGLNPYRSLPCGLTEDGWFYANWYMPFDRSFDLRLVNEGSGTVGVELEVITEKLRRPVHEYSRFHAKWHRDEFLPTEPERWLDWPVLKTTGTGRYVGVMLHVWNPRGAWWGEGDEKFFVDGEAFPSIFGTGTEDYFGYAWCSPELFEHAFHNQTRNDGNNRGHISVNRWHVADQVPFHRSLEVYLEKYFRNSRPTLYAAVVYWYLASGGYDPYLPLPLEERVGYTTAPVYPAIPGTVEGEQLKIRRCSGGRTQQQEMSGWGEGWSHDAQLWWTEAGPGDRLELEVPVEKGGWYNVQIYLTRARDYGIVQFYLDDRKVGVPVDLYHPQVIPSGAIQLGTHELQAGIHLLGVEIVGCHPSAVPAYMFGLDYLKLTPAESPSQGLIKP
ncbi:MAG: glycoside hydrolase family 172 protein [Verrucomicrobiota bacterium]|nr:DUF2961 domain-containing protein [Limisphaera sp.]MDW8382412.1 glycoside hydrolase family 172 protein [Verrucomicrobiota bacterium]